MLNCQNYQKEVCYYVVLNEVIKYVVDIDKLHEC